MSHEAGKAYSSDGTSLYDAVVIYSNDKDLVKLWINYAMAQVVARFYDVANGTVGGITLTLPDRDTANDDLIKQEIDNYIVATTCAKWFESHLASAVQTYTGMATASMQSLVMMIRHRV